MKFILLKVRKTGYSYNNIERGDVRGRKCLCKSRLFLRERDTALIFTFYTAPLPSNLFRRKETSRISDNKHVEVKKK